MRILTWNVQWFRGLDGRVDVARVLQHALRWGQQPHVIGLQEVAQHCPGLDGAGCADQVAQVRACLPRYEVFFAPAVDDWRPGLAQRQRLGNLIATRLPVLRVHPMALPYPADPTVPSMPRVLAALTVLAPWGPLRVGCTHLAYYSARQRLAQAQALVAWQHEAAQVAAAPPATRDEPPDQPFQARPHAADAVLMGDFNAPPHDAAYHALVGGAPPVWWDAWTVANPGRPQPPTFRVHEANAAAVTCDYVLVTAGLRARVRRVVVDEATTLSDHQPLLMELAPSVTI
ncbi:endonuclease/exonuclease/phosphatase family metal-dependent hydrolase [Tepidimonas ignava]|uniref:Endonuclease/Exonuclease/phosphatase family protein n=1 Tax=Tepidimonas ignava TaxID=114249 RepID=A0A4R3LFS7_9BURK|nr:endonuclease/exonuclease/phosphatase family protein [Tepidimonas ignava]TCS98335.1 endonuclease/exonuclease/phosphatase family metal-dependent hydrolase [Tepidimonas ignava]TSE21844.1 Endonuclease/Exonuclease/phosphatase family protein [Tepidimonas ignava]